MSEIPGPGENEVRPKLVEVDELDPNKEGKFLFKETTISFDDWYRPNEKLSGDVLITFDPTNPGKVQVSGVTAVAGDSNPEELSKVNREWFIADLQRTRWQSPFMTETIAEYEKKGRYNNLSAEQKQNHLRSLQNPPYIKLQLHDPELEGRASYPSIFASGPQQAESSEQK